MKEYELWLDESGDFEKNNQLHKHPSIVGGVLIEKGQFSDEEITQLVNAEANGGDAHGTTMDRQQVEEIMLPALEMLCHRHGKLVYFENKEHIATYSNRQLYLRILASGIVQLMQYLGKDGSFCIDVIIAVRYAPNDRGALEKIEEEEYIDALRRYIQEQWKSGAFDIDLHTRMNISILSARQERRLQLADYACNCRFTAHKKWKFTPEMRERLRALYDEDYIYSVYVKTPVNYIMSQLATGDVAEALLEYYTSRRPKELITVGKSIFGRLKNLSYRLCRLQVGQFVNLLTAFVRTETDFERSEALLKNVLQDFFAKLEEYGIEVQTDEAKFRLQWRLVDMYLREGDILHAQEVLDDMDKLLHSMNYRAENLRFLYLYLDRKALYEINCLEYEEAVKTMNKSIHCLENVREVLTCDDTIHDYFQQGDIYSEWLGNAYCMKIYAEMFMQRERPELYEQIKADTEVALQQYEYAGELERNQQYRAHIEMEAGHYQEALQWLFSTQQLDRENDLLENCVSYLDRALQEDMVSRTYYLMYYVEIMERAGSNGQENFAALMHEALEVQKEIMEELLLEGALDSDITSDNIRKEPVIYKDFLWKSLKVRPIEYHPLEIVLWKYGSYLAARGSVIRALTYWERAINICRSNPDYALMKVIGAAVFAESLYWLVLKEKDAEAHQQAGRAMSHIDKLLKEPLPVRMKDYLTECRQVIGSASSLKEDRESKALNCLKIAEKIAF